jgi:ribosome-associated heat shock protein Hsp15
MKAVARMRLDKWLWAARLFKTRALAVEAIERGRVEVGGQIAKASRELHAGDVLRLVQPPAPARELTVLGLSMTRGPAAVAQTLYAETEVSVAARAAWAEARRLAPEPEAVRDDGRPTKRERRELDSERWQRWSASIDDDSRKQ